LEWEAAHPCVSKEAKPAKFYSLIEKDCARPQKGLKEILRALTAVRGEPLGWGYRERSERQSSNFQEFLIK